MPKLPKIIWLLFFGQFMPKNVLSWYMPKLPKIFSLSNLGQNWAFFFFMPSNSSLCPTFGKTLFDWFMPKLPKQINFNLWIMPKLPKKYKIPNYVKLWAKMFDCFNCNQIAQTHQLLIHAQIFKNIYPINFCTTLGKNIFVWFMPKLPQKHQILIYAQTS